MSKPEEYPTLFITFLQQANHPIICDEVYDSLISFGPINRIIKLGSSPPDKPQLLVEFAQTTSCNACMNHLAHAPLPRINLTAIAERSKMKRLTVKGESQYTRDYTLFPRPSHLSNFPNTRVLLVNDLPRRLTPETCLHLYNLFALFGSVTKVNVIREKRMALIEYGMVDDLIQASTLCSECPFYETILETTQSKHITIAAPVGEYCKIYDPRIPPFKPTMPSVFVGFMGLHPIVSRSPNIPMALCHYFDHYSVPRPVDVFFENEQKGVFAFRDLKDAVCCITVMNRLNENGFILELGFVDEPPMIPQENLQYLKNQIYQMNQMNQVNQMNGMNGMNQMGGRPPMQNMNQNINQNMNQMQPMPPMNQMVSPQHPPHSMPPPQQQQMQRQGYSNTYSPYNNQPQNRNGYNYQQNERRGDYRYGQY